MGKRGITTRDPAPSQRSAGLPPGQRIASVPEPQRLMRRYAELCLNGFDQFLESVTIFDEVLAHCLCT